MTSFSFELLNLTCVKSKRSDFDTVKFYIAGTSEAGDVDKLESNTTPTQQDLLQAEYDFQAGKTLVLANSPPVGRANWISEPVEISETSDVVLALMGIGLHKTELGGGADPNSVAGQIAAFVRENIVTLIPKIGKPIAKLLEIAEEVANADPDKDCYGSLFVFKRTFSGADLIFSLIKDPFQSLSFEASDSEDVQVHENCRRPAYKATIALRNGKAVAFDDEVRHEEKSKSAPIELKNFWGPCKPNRPAFFWVVGRQIVLRFKPNTVFNVLRYSWRINGFGNYTILAEGSGEYAIQAHVSRYNRQTGQPNVTTESVQLRCTVGRDGALEIVVPETAGQFAMNVSCDLLQGDQKAHIYSKSFRIETETLEGNAEYQEYQACVRGWWRQQKAKFDKLAERLREIPVEIPHYDPADLTQKWEGLAVTADKLVKNVDKLVLTSVKRRLPR